MKFKLKNKLDEGLTRCQGRRQGGESEEGWREHYPGLDVGLLMTSWQGQTLTAALDMLCGRKEGSLIIAQGLHGETEQRVSGRGRAGALRPSRTCSAGRA